MTLSIISIIIAVISALIAYKAVQEQKRVSKLQLNVQLLFETEQQLINNPELLNLHGISIQNLAEIGVTGQEFIYILNSLRAGQAYALIHNNEKFSITNYRSNLLDSAKVQKVWEMFIKEKFLIETSFTKAIDNYYKNKVNAKAELNLQELKKTEFRKKKVENGNESNKKT